MTTAGDLCERGYLPKELPPPFSSAKLGALVRSGWSPRIPTTSCATSHNLFRWGTLRRKLSIPNPLAYVALAREIEATWSQLQPLLNASPWSLTKPVASTERAVTRQHDHSVLQLYRATTRAGNRYGLRADISRFYHSIYTHTLEWAIHSKNAVKANRALPRGQRVPLWGSRLDDRHRDLQERQSVGIPVGPDSSLIAAEVLLAQVDQAVLPSVVPNGIGFRYVDDYDFYFPTLAAAESALSALQGALAEYELALNPTKTQIFDLPTPLEPSWVRSIRRIDVAHAGARQKSALIDLFDSAFELRDRVPDTHVLRFAMGQARHVTVAPQNWSLVQPIFLQGMAVEPGIIREVLAELLRYRALGYALDVPRIGWTLAQVIKRHALLDHGSEVAWALWAHIQLGIPVHDEELTAAEGMSDPIVALVALDAVHRRLTSRAAASTVWNGMMTAAELVGAGWLLAYEAAVKGWLPDTHIAQDPDFAAMRANGVEFYQFMSAPQLAPIVIPGGGGGGGEPSL